MAADKGKTSVKHLQIDKTQSTMLVVVALAVAICVFSLFATKALVAKGLYQRRALNARRDIVATLKDNLAAADTLRKQYQVFAEQNPNVLGSPIDGSGNGNTDDSNPVIVLDALPSKYDAPALASSIEKVMSGRSVTINSLTVTDDPAANSDQAQAQPQTKSIQFSFEGSTDYKTGQKLLQDFEKSIRPFDLNSLEISGKDNSMKLSVTMTTYFQPAKSLDLTATKEVK